MTPLASGNGMNMPGMGSATHHAAHHATHAMAGMTMGPAPAYNAHTLLTDWLVQPFPVAVAVVCAAIAVWYLLAVRRLAARDRHWPVARTVSFLFGLAFVVLAIGSSIASLSMYTFTAHVIQHLVLMIAAPPLLALGAPMTLLLQTQSRPVKRVLLRGLHSKVFGVIRHPVPVFFFYYVSMYVFFLSPLLGYAMDHMPVMNLINLFFLGGATLFWWPMVGIDPIPGGGMGPGFKIINLLIGVPAESFLGLAILLSTTPVASIYTLTSTHVGGGVLWAASEVATFAAMAPVFMQWTRADARLAKRIDARLDAGETIEPPKLEGGGMAATFRALRRG